MSLLKQLAVSNSEKCCDGAVLIQSICGVAEKDHLNTAWLFAAVIRTYVERQLLS